MMHRIRVAGFSPVCRLLLKHGVTPADFLKRLDLPPALLLDRRAWVDRELSFRISNEAARVTGDRFTGLHTMESSRLEHLDSWGDAILRARNLQEALDTAERKIGHIVTGLRLGIELTDRQVKLWHKYDGALGADPLQSVEPNSLILKAILDLTGESIDTEVRLPHAKPAHSDELERLLGPRLSFNADRAELVFDRDALRLPLRTHPVVPLEDAYSLPPETPCETAGAVMRILRDLIEFERPTAAAVADSLDINLRTMQRRLAVWGVTFEELLEGYRWRKAADYLAEGQFNITEIAFRLGYSDSAHFTRAYRRWYGCSPGKARTELKHSPLENRVVTPPAVSWNPASARAEALPPVFSYSTASP